MVKMTALHLPPLARIGIQHQRQRLRICPTAATIVTPAHHQILPLPGSLSLLRNSPDGMLT